MTERAAATPPVAHLFDPLDADHRRAVTVRFGGYFREVKEVRPAGIMPMTRRLGDLLETTVLPNPVVLSPISVRVAKLSPERWGFKSAAEMMAVFEREEGVG